MPKPVNGNPYGSKDVARVDFRTRNKSDDRARAEQITKAPRLGRFLTVTELEQREKDHARMAAIFDDMTPELEPEHDLSHLTPAEQAAARKALADRATLQRSRSGRRYR